MKFVIKNILKKKSSGSDRFIGEFTKYNLKYTITLKIKYLGINLTKHIHGKNFKTLMKEIKDDLNIQRHAAFMDCEN